MDVLVVGAGVVGLAIARALAIRGHMVIVAEKTGGKYGVGRRMPIRVTRRLLTAALDGSLNRADFRRDPYFGFAVPTSVPGVEPHILYPVKTWQNKAEFAETAKRLIDMFNENFKRFEGHVDSDVRSAGPQTLIAA